jgi:hypothetical protein
VLVGLGIFALTRRSESEDVRGPLDARAAAWVWPWLAGMVVIGYFGRYGGTNAIPNWWDLVVVAVFAIVIYELAEKLALSSQQAGALIDAEEEDFLPELQT